MAALLDVETQVRGVTAAPRAEMKVIGVPTRAGGGQLNAAGGELDVTAGWGGAGCPEAG